MSNCSNDNMCINRPTLGQSSVSPGRCQGPLISLCVHSLPSNIWASQLPSGHEKHSSLFGVVYLQVYFLSLEGMDGLSGEALSRRRHCSFLNGYQQVVVVVIVVVTVLVVVIEN